MISRTVILAPASASAWANARPRPQAAPVRTAVWPWQENCGLYQFLKIGSRAIEVLTEFIIVGVLTSTKEINQR